MAKIPFDVKFRPQIESGEYKVETRDGKPVRIICWDRAPKFGDSFDLTLCVLIPQDNGEGVYYYNHSGKSRLDRERFDLFIITPEPELSEFEMAIHRRLNLVNGENLLATELLEETKGMAAELLDLARKELIKEGTSKNEMGTMLYDAGFEDGKEEALKDLPRWEKQEYAPQEANIYLPTNELVYHGMAISIDDLTKLPGFKED